ncbi:unnamed protein product [Cunninghamella echinulata]
MLILIILSPSIMMLFVYFTWKYREYQRKLKDLAPCHIVSNLPSRVFQREKHVATTTTTTTANGDDTADDHDRDTINRNNPTYFYYQDNDECAICLDEYVNGDKIRTLPCHHEFHAFCIDIWLTTRKKFCPICKSNICQNKSLPSSTPTTTSNESLQPQQPQQQRHQQRQQQEQEYTQVVNEQTPLLPY